ADRGADSPLSKPLTTAGTLAALIVGVVTYLGGQYGWHDVPAALGVLFAFFITSVGFSFAGRKRKELLVDVPKGGSRDAWQVAANGGVATVSAALAAFISHDAQPGHVAYALLFAFAGAYAAATADTWSTEIGSAFGGNPRSIVGFAPIAPGLSGGVTLLGTTAMFAGAAWVALVFALLAHRTDALGIVMLAGIAGALADSILGATLQRIEFCASCKRQTEMQTHACGTATIHWRGVRWMTNDAVNALATLTRGLVSAGLFLAG
ncbi:MAG: DUF92 domain-containing protein, partial [Vulcanimicrobiaceae bacterium]